MAESLTFETGLVEYDINGMATVRFNPTDSVFVERLYKTMRELDSRQDEFQQRVDAIEIGEHGEGGEEMFAFASERDADMRKLIDELLGDGVADAVFPNMNCYALGDGLPIWVNLVFAVAEKVSEAYDKEHQKGDPRLKQYSDKYAGMRAKYKRGKK